MFCIHLGGYLASIHDSSSNDQVYDLCVSTGVTGWSWIGLKNDEWSNNTPYDYNPGIIQSAHKNCTAMAVWDVNKKWGAVPCTNHYSFICQFVTTNPTQYPTKNPTVNPIISPTINPTTYPSPNPSLFPTIQTMKIFDIST
eukprot:261763_1